MGLGLASASLICKALQGELNLIRSEENEGSKFHFTMAIKIGDPIEHRSESTILCTEGTRGKLYGKSRKPKMGLESSSSVSIYGKDEHGKRRIQASGEDSP
jgi:hypothetical protein